MVARARASGCSLVSSVATAQEITPTGLRSSWDRVARNWSFSIRLAQQLIGFGKFALGKSSAMADGDDQTRGKGEDRDRRQPLRCSEDSQPRGSDEQERSPEIADQCREQSRSPAEEPHRCGNRRVAGRVPAASTPATVAAARESPAPPARTWRRRLILWPLTRAHQLTLAIVGDAAALPNGESIRRRRPSRFFLYFRECPVSSCTCRGRRSHSETLSRLTRLACTLHVL